MEFNQLLELIDKLDASSLSYLDFSKGDSHVELSKTAKGEVTSAVSNTGAVQEDISDGISSNLSNAPLAEEIDTEIKTEVKPASSGVPLKSPMVGVAYLQADPGDDPYVSVGDYVEKGQTVIIIEAMKMMTEIPAHVSGVIQEINVENEELVEYDQELISIQPVN